MSKSAENGTLPAEGQEAAIRWRNWSRTAFEEASAAKKLVLLDLSAEWCHWCHVMDQTTYSDPDIIRTINDRFIPVRVDIDKRPDISERYNRGGFPTTAFLSDLGEAVWGATYIPPEEMKNVLKAMLEASEKGEIDAALETARMQYLDLSKAAERNEGVDSKFVDAVFEDIFAAYDVEWGGFGMEPKFPHPPAVDLLLERYSRTDDKELAVAVRSTLDHMTKGLYDEAEGGVFRYSVKRDWKLPHYEKMLDTNLGFLRNLTRARLILGDERFEQTAKGVAAYLLGTLRDPESGGFYSSQDADEEYYKLSKDERIRHKRPKIIKETFSGLNSRVASALIEAGVLLGQKAWIEAGKGALRNTLRDHWNPGEGLVRHAAGDELHLFDDQVDFMEALISVAETQQDSASEKTLAMATDLVKAVDKAFAHGDGGHGDVRRESEAIGKLAEPERSIVANSRWARSLALLGAATFDPELTKDAWKILRSFPPKRVQANGIFAADYVYAWDSLEIGARNVEIHGITGKEPSDQVLWTAAKRVLNPGVVVLPARRAMVETQVPRPFAVVCRETGCSKEIYEPGELASALKPVLPGQI